MEQHYEIIHFNNKNLGRVFLHRMTNISKHWHRSIEILFILSGTVTAVVDNKSYLLQETDIILVNSMSIHEYSSDGAELLAFQLELDDSPLFDKYKNTYFDCCSAGNTKHPSYEKIKRLLARLVKANSDGSQELLTYAILSLLLLELVNNFSSNRHTHTDDIPTSYSVFNTITDYIDKNYTDSLTLQKIAEKFHFSQSYLSRLFKKNTNMTFSDYYNSIRLFFAVNELVSTKKSISDIAHDNGFPDSRAFVSLFKKEYKVLPREYRLEHGTSMPVKKNHTEENYLAVVNTSSLASLAQYLNDDDFSILKPLPVSLSKPMTINAIDMQKSQKILRHKWRTLCCVGSSRDLLFDNVRNMLRKMQQDMPYRYIKFHGLLSDDIMIYDESPDGTPLLSFTILDQILDFLMSIGLKPLMQFFGMPSALASDPRKTSFYTHQNMSLPKDINKWNYLISQTVKHCIARYGIDEVLTWPFSLWNEPDSTTEMFGFDNKEDFFQLYSETYRTVKSVHPDLYFGTPGLLYIPEDTLNWYTPFFSFCKSRGTIPDFVNIHFYDDDIELIDNAMYGNKIINRLSPIAGSFSDYLDEALSSLKKHGMAGKPVYMIEWNLTISHRNLISDTCFLACYLTKNLLENYDRLNSYGYWSLTDFINELQLPENPFHGGLGLFNLNGIPKAHYNAFTLLTHLQDIKVEAGDGWFITRNPASTKYSIIIYNYCHYDKIFSSGEVFDLTETNRYTAFFDLKSLEITVNMKNLLPGQYKVTETFVNREEGSAYDTWVKMGAPKPLSGADIDYLIAKSKPGRLSSIIYSNDTEYIYHQTVLPLEVRLIEFEFISK